MSATGDDFRTFCHLSEYGEEGYAQLHRMLAASAPLVLWAPSTSLLQSRDCLVQPMGFLHYVERGDIRVIGRERWLTSSRYRNAHSWPGAAWNAEVDDKLAEWAETDKVKPLSERKVVVAAEEGGPQAAEQRLQEDPNAEKETWSALVRADSAGHLPPGVLQSAERQNAAGVRKVGPARCLQSHRRLEGLGCRSVPPAAT